MTDLTALNLGLFILRVAIGITFAAHGYNKFFGGGRIPGTARWFDSMGMRPGKLNALMAASTEMGSGLLFAAGLLTPFAAAGIIGMMLVAAYTVHVKNGFFIVKDGFEYNFVLIVIAVSVAIVGPWRWSIDHALGIDLDLNGLTGLLIAVLLGAGGAVAQLVAFYRPPREVEVGQS